MMSIQSAKIGITVASLCASMAWAETDNEFGNVQFHGFASQNIISTSDNNFFGDSQDTSTEYYELGLNAIWQLNSRLKFAAQVLSRDAGATDDGKFRLDYAFVDYSFWQTEDTTAGVRLGRMVNPYGMYNDTRDIAHTRPSILLPQSVYFDVNRNLALSADGGSLYLEQHSEFGELEFQLSKLKPRTRDPDLEPALFFSDLPGKLEGDLDKTWLARAIYSYDLDRFRLGITTGSIAVKYDPAEIDVVQSAGLVFKPLLAFAQYNSGLWSLTGEIASRRIKQQVLVSAQATEIKIRGTSYFVQLTRRLTDSVEVFARYDDLIWNNKDKKGTDFSRATGLPAHSRYAKDWTVGIRWDVNDSWMVRLEAHDIKGTGWLSRLENPNPSLDKEDWRLYAFSVSARF